MGIRERLEDAKLLWENGRKEGAWIQVLIAAAATSRLRFPMPPPKPKGQKRKKGPKAKTPNFNEDKEAFTAFIREVTPTILTGTRPAIPGGIHVILRGDTPDAIPLDLVIYKHLRCHLLHQAELHTDIRLSPSRIENGKWVADFFGGSPLVIPDFWVLNLAKAVQDAPENAALFTGNRRES